MKGKNNHRNKKSFSKAVLLASLCAITTLGAFGCHHGRGNLTGKWIVDLSKMDIGTGPTADVARKVAPTIWIEFTNDGKYVQNAMGFQLKGTYKVVGTNLEMTSDEGGTSSPVKPDGIITNGGNTITFNTGPKLVAFKRAGS